MQPDDLQRTGPLEQRMIQFIDETASLSATIRFRLPMVMAMSRENIVVGQE